MVFEAIKTQIAGRVAFGEKVRYYFSPGGKKIHRSCCEEGDVRGIACFMLSAGWGVRPEARESEVPIIRERVIMTFGYFRETKDPLSISIVCHSQYDFPIFWPQIARRRSIIIVVTVLLEIARERSLAKTLRNRNPSYLH